jgi:hypothetical protein
MKRGAANQVAPLDFFRHSAHKKRHGLGDCAASH